MPFPSKDHPRNSYLRESIKRKKVKPGKTRKDKELFGLSKIPDKALLKASQVEVGKLNAYISELEDTLASRDKEIADLKATVERQQNNIFDIEKALLQGDPGMKKFLNSLQGKRIDNFFYLLTIQQLQKKVEQLEKKNNAFQSVISGIKKGPMPKSTDSPEIAALKAHYSKHFSQQERLIEDLRRQLLQQIQAARKKEAEE